MKKKQEQQYVAGAVAFLALALVSYLGYTVYSQNKTIESLQGTGSNLSDTLAERTAELEEASTTIATLRGQIEELAEDFEDLTDDYKDERDKNEDFEDQLRGLSKTVGILDKLSKTDEELLQKYSKVYFLNEHYVPESLRTIDKKYTYDESRTYELHSKVLPYFREMLEDALDDGVELWVVSAYRSFQTQAQLKGQYLVTYGSGANTFSADQGYSEHQLGTTVDFTTRGISGGFDGFENTAAYTWLKENAYKYGFTLSYPENNAYYVYEPWHWRFVGEDLARDLNKANASFYDWEQRKIDEYLISIFD